MSVERVEKVESVENVLSGQVYFISGIDTAIGKTYATGYLAKLWQQQGRKVITQKLIQTGNVGFSEDIHQHRLMMGNVHFAEDDSKLTMPEIFAYPASPHLASRLEGREVDFAHITAATQQLASRYEVVLLEGAGGVMVPLSTQVLTIDYIAAQQLPVILVTSGRLGSINHTLLSLEALKARQLPLYALAYNLKDQSLDPIISEDTASYLKTYLSTHFPEALWIDIPVL